MRQLTDATQLFKTDSHMGGVFTVRILEREHVGDMVRVWVRVHAPGSDFHGYKFWTYEECLEAV